MAVNAGLNTPAGIAADSLGNLYIAEYYGHRVRKIDPDGVITTIAGTGTAGYNGDEIPAVAAELAHPIDMSADDSGNLYIADESNHRVRRVDSEGVIRHPHPGRHGEDFRGQPMEQPATAKISVGYTYGAVYYEPSEFEGAFGQPGGEITPNRARQEVTLWDTRTVRINHAEGSPPAKPNGISKSGSESVKMFPNVSYSILFTTVPDEFATILRLPT